VATVLDLLTGSLRLIGAANPGEALDAQTAKDALQALNDRIETLNLEHLTNPKGVTRLDVTTTPNQAAHTIGTGGNFNVPRPVVIDKALVTFAGAEHPVEIVDDDHWAAIPIKDMAGLPTTLYYEPAYPLGKVHLYPKPDGAYSLALWCWDSLPTYTMAQLNVEMPLPPGYRRMLRFNLALDLASDGYGKEPSASVVNNAVESLAAIKRANHTTPIMEVDGAFLQGGCPAGGDRAAFMGGE